MTTTKQATPKQAPESSSPPAEEALRKALSAQPDATATDLAATASLDRSTASKTLARLERAGHVRRREGGRDGARRLPDRWTLTTATPAPDATAEQDREPAKNATPASNHERLKPGQLESLVLTYMQEHPAEPLGPDAVAKALERSSGAVGNGLARLTRAKKVRQVNDKPRRYQIAA
jgi:predicted Rossmann fold nucleotide-binding protein DprA/Smf involved in DNA uptake